MRPGEHREAPMPFVIATGSMLSIEGGSPNPVGKAVQWYFMGMGKWSRDIGKGKRYDAEEASMQLVLLKDKLPNQKFTFMVVDQLPLAAEAASMDPAELERLAKLARSYWDLRAQGYSFSPVPPPHEPRIYKVGEIQCECPMCVDRLIALFPELG